MRRIYRDITTPSREWIELMLPLIFLILMTLVLVSCVTRPFPAKSIWEFDSRSGVCGEYSINTNTSGGVSFNHVRDVQLKDCPSLFGFSLGETPDVIEWIRQEVHE